MNLLSQPFLGPGWRYLEGGRRHLRMYIFGRFHVIRCVLVVHVRGSHVKKPFQYVARLFKGRNDAEIERSYGPERWLSYVDPQDSGSLKTYSAFTRARLPKKGDRSLIQLRYGLRDYGTGHKRISEPLPLAASGRRRCR
jgi:hypothetical protein